MNSQRLTNSLFLLFVLIISKQIISPDLCRAYYQKEDSIVGIMFYNVENLFDIQDDSLKNDEEFLPVAPRRWTYSRMKQKFTNISRVILNAGGWNLPVIIGLCEVENSWVLSSLLYETGLYGLGYRYVHHESPDERGIDVAMFYRTNHFSVINSTSYVVDFGENDRPTRDILYVKGILKETDTLHLFVNHWPSRLGGAIATHPKREKAAMTLKSVCDSIMSVIPDAKIIIMGDFNEEAKSEIIRDKINAGDKDDELPFVNLALHAKGAEGTLKYQQTWSVFDQIIVSGSLLNNKSSIRLKEPVQHIIALPFLLEHDPVYGGQRPFRTYSGFRYIGGFSDHLPVLIELEILTGENVQ